MKRTLKVTIILISIIIFALLSMCVSLVIYFYTGNISSKLPETLLQECNAKVEKYQNRNVFILTSKQEKEDYKTIFYLHGGSYVAELNDTHWRFFTDIIRDTGATIIVPDYPLTPQYQYTDVFAMIEPLYEQIASKVEQEDLILMGDSAGGGMALALLEKVTVEDKKVPSKTILISPWLDVTMENSAIDQVQSKDSLLNKQVLKLAGIAYAGTEENTKNYLVSPIYGPLTGLKNIVIFTGTNDILNPDVHRLKQIGEEQKASIQIKETYGATHDWLLNRYQDARFENELATSAYEDLIKEIENK